MTAKVHFEILSFVIFVAGFGLLFWHFCNVRKGDEYSNGLNQVERNSGSSEVRKCFLSG